MTAKPARPQSPRFMQQGSRLYGVDGLLYDPGEPPALRVRPMTLIEALREGLRLMMTPRWQRPLMAQSSLGYWEQLGPRRSLSGRCSFMTTRAITRAELDQVIAVAMKHVDAADPSESRDSPGSASAASGKA